MKKIDISRNINNLLILKQQVDELLNDLKSGEFVRKIAEEAATAIYEDINEIFYRGVEEWYSYKPKYYKRTGSFYDVYDVKKSGTHIEWEIKPEAIASYGHRVDSVDDTYIYRNMWEGGFHGGAASGKEDKFKNPFPGPMALRTPVPRFASDELPPYSLWSKNHAKQTTSPSSLIDRNIMLYQKDSGRNYSGSNLQTRLDDAFECVCRQYEILN